jgi:predicted dehydrogenase
MKRKQIRVGFIGLNPDSHWASMTHFPALKFLSEKFEVIGVANTSLQSAKKTARALGLKYAFSSAQELIDCDEIDLVVVTVKVPYHYELVSAALKAGKNVHCEWPLGNGLDEAQKLAKLAKEKNVLATVGNQMRTAVEVLYLKKLIQEGYVGDVLSTSLIADAGNWGAQTIQDLAYLSDKSNGATMLSIPFGHTMAGVKEVLDDFEDISARMIKRRDEVYITDANKSIATTAEDQIMVNGVFKSGAAMSAHYRGGLSRGTNFLWEINGTKGDIQVKADIGHAQMTQLFIFGAQEEQKQMQALFPPRELYEKKPKNVMVRNVAGIYSLIAKDIREGTRKAPSFEDALELHRLLDKIEKSSQEIKKDYKECL